MLWPTLHSVESFPAFREKRARGWRLCAAAALIFAASAVCFGFAVAFVSVKGTVSKPLIHGCINYENEHACEGAPEYVPARWFNLSFDLEPWPCVWLGATADVAESACQDPHCKDPLVVVGRPLPGSDRAALQQPPVERLTRLLVLYALDGCEAPPRLPPFGTALAAPPVPTGDQLVDLPLIAGVNVADEVRCRGKTTFVPEASGSHFDVTNGDDGDLVEQKMCYPHEEPSDVHMSKLQAESELPANHELAKYGFLGELPPAITGYVRCKVGWLSRALEDIDCHQLCDEHHLLRCGREFFASRRLEFPAPSGSAGSATPAAMAAAVAARRPSGGQAGPSSAGSGGGSGSSQKRKGPSSAGPAAKARRTLASMRSPRGAWRYEADSGRMVLWPYGVAVTDWENCPY